jgi:N-methylhydantoinase A
VFLGRIPPHLLGGEIPLDVDAARDGIEQLASKLGLTPEACATGILEISAWNQANALRQVTVKRGLDVRDFTLTTFGGSGSLLLCRLMDVLGIPTVLVPPNPGNVSAFGLLTVDVKNDYVQTHVSLAEHLDPAGVARIFDDLTARAAEALATEGFAAEQHQFVRTADLRYFGQAFEVRVAVPDGPVDAAALAEVARRFHAEHTALYGYDFADDPTQQVEWVNLRVSGIGPIKRPEIRRHAAESGLPTVTTPDSTVTTPDSTVTTPDSTRRRPVCFDATDGYADTPVLWRPDLAPGTVVAGPAVIEEFGSTVPLHPGFTARVDDFLNIIVTRSQTPTTTPEAGQ